MTRALWILRIYIPYPGHPGSKWQFFDVIGLQITRTRAHRRPKGPVLRMISHVNLHCWGGRGLIRWRPRQKWKCLLPSLSLLHPGQLK